MSVGYSTEDPASVGETTERADKCKGAGVVGWALGGRGGERRGKQGAKSSAQ